LFLRAFTLAKLLKYLVAKEDTEISPSKEVNNSPYIILAKSAITEFTSEVKPLTLSKT